MIEQFLQASIEFAKEIWFQLEYRFHLEDTEAFKLLEPYLIQIQDNPLYLVVSLAALFLVPYTLLKVRSLSRDRERKLDELIEEMEEELEEDWKNVARAGLATAALGMGVAGMPDSVKPDDFSPDKGAATKLVKNVHDYNFSSAEIKDMANSPQYKNLYIKYANKFKQDAKNSTDRNLVKRAAHIYAQAEFLSIYPDAGDHIGKASELGQNPGIIPGTDDFQKDMDAEELAKAKAKDKEQQDYDNDRYIPSSMPDRDGGKALAKARADLANKNANTNK